MRQAAIAIFAGLGLAVCCALAAAAQPARSVAPRQEAAAPADVGAQVRPRARRAPTRITVTPHSRLYRECVDWYALEYRASGPVLTPQMRCRWAIR
jgi:hypothetical protein